MWLPAFACPSCRAVISSMAYGYVCHLCDRRYPEVEGIVRLVTAERLQEAAPFLEQYRDIRLRDGHGPRTAERYRALPDVPRDDTHRAEWRIRRESYATLLNMWRRARRLRPKPARMLDIGAGNGWLSHRLSTEGHAVVAVDLNVDDGDGLGACHRMSGGCLPVQADFDALPFAPRQFDLVVLNASLHYSPAPARTLCEAYRMVSEGGTLVVMDSPMFVRAADGEAMVQQQQERMHHELGITPVRSGLGCLTFSLLDDWARGMGRQARFVASRGSLRWRLGRWRARVNLGRPPATFGVWVAQ